LHLLAAANAPIFNLYSAWEIAVSFAGPEEVTLLKT